MATDDIFILDCGFQFREDDTPGIDYILPNTGYLEERREALLKWEQLVIGLVDPGSKVVALRA